MEAGHPSNTRQDLWDLYAAKSAFTTGRAVVRPQDDVKWTVETLPSQDEATVLVSSLCNDMALTLLSLDWAAEGKMLMRSSC